MAHADTSSQDIYYIPHGSYWPMVGSVALFMLVGGIANMLNGGGSLSTLVMAIGALLLVLMLFGWFGAVIRESVGGLYNEQVDVSFRMGMVWFIFSEVMFFAAFFGALFYARVFSIPWLGGEGSGLATQEFLWLGYSAAWPTNGPGDIGGAFQTIPAWGIPLLNTLILLTSGVTITIAHHALIAGRRSNVLFWLAATVLLSVVFMYFQIYEYVHAYRDLDLTLGSGIYGSTFFMLTGFHGMHVTLGGLMLAVIWFRVAKGHFSKENHFGFEAVAWYWHFVDVVWLGLFLFVYVI